MAIDIDKITFFVVEEYGPRMIEDRVLYRNQWEVIFLHEDRKGLRVKAGMLRDPHRKEYGVDVFATFNGHDFWSNSGADMSLMRAMANLYKNGSSTLPVLDTTTIKR